MQTNITPDTPEDYCGTTYAAKLLGLSVGTIQTLVEKNELQAWKTQGGHRRISMPSIREYQRKHNMLTIQTELPEGSIFMAKPINMDWFNGFFTAFLAGRYIELHTSDANKASAQAA